MKKLQKGLNPTLQAMVVQATVKIATDNIRRICKLRFENNTATLTNDEIVSTYQYFSRDYVDGYIGNDPLKQG